MKENMIEIIILVYMTVLSIFDLYEKKVPAVMLFVGAVATFMYSAILILSGDFIAESFVSVLLGSVPGLLLSAIAITTKKVGIADGIILTLLGIMTDYRRGILIFGVSMVIMALFSVALLVLKRIKKNSELPYLPFLTIAFCAVCLFGG